MRRAFVALVAILAIGVIACDDRVKLKVKVGVRDASVTKTATTAPAVP
jgi:hypothetical protein